MPSKKKSFHTTGNAKADRLIQDLIKECEIVQEPEIYREMLATLLKFAKDKPDTGDLKQLAKTIKEMRHANRIFQPYLTTKKVCIFGSSRTQPAAAEYKAARTFGRIMVENGYMVITGGGNGIMGAAQAGAGRERSFALNIELPFEQTANETIQGDPKLITFKYFFTRKLNFVKNAAAIALFPGGFGTMDEGFETITLLQTGKAPIVPVVFVDAPNGKYWKTFDHYLKEHLLRDGMISADDFFLFKITDDLEAARKEIMNFYYNFHSYRYVHELCVIRMHRPIPEAAIERMKEDFSDILTDKEKMFISKALPEESNVPELAKLPRLCLNFNRQNYGRLRQLIDRINLF